MENLHSFRRRHILHIAHCSLLIGHLRSAHRRFVERVGRGAMLIPTCRDLWGKRFPKVWSALLLAVFQGMTVLAQSAASPPAIFLQPQFPIVAVGSNLTFTVVALVPEPLTYKWFFNSTPLEVPDSPSLVLTNLQFTNCGAYSVVVSNREGAAAEATLLTVMRPPVIFACGPCLCSTITPAG